MHTREWRDEMERLGATDEVSYEWNKELPCAAFISIPEAKNLVPRELFLVSRLFTMETLIWTSDYRRILLVRLRKCLRPMILAEFLWCTRRESCTLEFNYHLSKGRAIFGGMMANTLTTMRRTLLPDGIRSIFMTKGNFLGDRTEETYWGPKADNVYGSVNESLSWIGLSHLYQYCGFLTTVAVTMRGNKTPMDNYIYWFALEAFRWLDNGSIREVELVYEEDGPTDRLPDIWKELFTWASQDWRDNQGAFWRFGWHGLEYIRKWSNTRWKYERLPNRVLDRRGRFCRNWDYEGDREEVIEEAIVWSVRKDVQVVEMGILGQCWQPDHLMSLVQRLAIS
ncbi:hypothetical protein TWF730_007038 [Orbilia blumenaviensis]|uniref:Uncharacterized protein n=1 Tax=Orbilia blumenaviensis TaxID=1796055 RepID=A0AAV9VGJ5_9PEZI